MNILLGPSPFQARWQLTNYWRLESWLERRPWFTAEPAFACSVPAKVHSSRTILDAARRLFGLHGEGAYWTELGEFDLESPDLGVQLCHWSDIPTTSDRALANTLGASLLTRPRVFVAQLRSPQMVLPWEERLARLSEMTQKLHGAPLCFLFAVASNDEDRHLTQLDVAWPSSTVRAQTEGDRWVAYVHERVAWHVGGRIDDAVDVLERACRLVKGDDAGLEAVLTEHARVRFECTDIAVRIQLSRSLDVLAAHPELFTPQIVPGSGDVPRPLPWLARALLAEFPDHPKRRFLRAAVTCRSMAMRLLGRCIDMEAKIKDAAIDVLISNQSIPADRVRETVEAYRRLHDGGLSIESCLAPQGHPLPDHPWELASLGTIEHYASELVPNATSEVRRVRNAIAHGSPVSWRAFTVVENLEREVFRATRS